MTLWITFCDNEQCFKLSPKVKKKGAEQARTFAKTEVGRVPWSSKQLLLTGPSAVCSLHENSLTYGRKKVSQHARNFPLSF